jgi:hypothetical protein
MRLTVAPDRKVVSRAAVVRTRSAAFASGERAWLVMAIVIASRSRADSRNSTVSVVAPECEIATATSFGPASALATSAACTSGHENAVQPMRCSFLTRSAATIPEASTPNTSMRPAAARAATAASQAAVSSAFAVSLIAPMSA